MAELIATLYDLLRGLLRLFRKGTTPRHAIYKVVGVASLAGCVSAWMGAWFGPEDWQRSLFFFGIAFFAGAVICGHMRFDDAVSSEGDKKRVGDGRNGNGS